MTKGRIIAIITIFTLCLTGCILHADVAETEKKEYDIQYFTDRTDQFYEYTSSTKVAFVVTTELGRYHFSDNEMPLDTVYEYMEAFEAGISFAHEWFGQDNIKLLDLYFIQRDLQAEYGQHGLPEGIALTGSGADGVAWVEYEYSVEPPSPFEASHVLMHEAVHALCGAHSETSNFPKRTEGYPFYWSQLFEEGLATMLEHMYGYNSGRLHDVQYTKGGSRSSEGALDEVSNVAEALGSFALYDMECYDFYDEFPYDILRSYGTSASFLYYLLEHNGSKEDLRRVYADINLMEEVYGKDMDGMIEEWLKSLEQYK